MSLWIRCLSASLLIVCLLIYSAEGQKKKKHKSKSKAVKSQCDVLVNQGVKGQILFLEGNQMPSPDRPPSVGKGVSREVGIFEVTHTDQTVAGHSSGFYKKVKTKLIKATWSDSKGCLALELPEGKYSILVKENGEWYANLFDGDGAIFPIEVKEGETTPLEFRITYKAAF